MKFDLSEIVITALAVSLIIFVFVFSYCALFGGCFL